MRQWWVLGWLAACQPDEEGTSSDANPAPDADGDGFDRDDCDDDDALLNPEADEACDGVDNDCDGAIDDDDDDLTDGILLYTDADGDGFGDPESATVLCDAEGRVTTGEDCDDTASDAFPGGVETCGDGVDQDCADGDEVCAASTATLPVAPAAGSFMWQSLQTAFVDSAGAPCTASIAVTMGDQALCYVDPAGELLCAGRIWTETWGPSFVDTGLGDVVHALLTSTFNVENGNAVCALAAGVPTCLGYWNFSGQLGTGGTDSSDVFTPWIAGTDLTHLATGTTDQYCGPDGAGDVWCTGLNFGWTPSIADHTGAASVWIDTFGELHVDQAGVFRASQGRTECTVTAAGLDCRDATWGRAGHVVDGGFVQPRDPTLSSTVVWLEDDGTVHLGAVTGNGSVNTSTRLDAGRVLAIAYNYYTTSVCGVYDDGSMACWGTNDQGKFGNGSNAPLDVDTEVLPAGTFDLTCGP